MQDSHWFPFLANNSLIKSQNNELHSLSDPSKGVMMGHELRMTIHQLSRSAMVANVRASWKRARSGYVKTSHRLMKTITVEMSHVGRCRLSGRGSRDYRNR